MFGEESLKITEVIEYEDSYQISVSSCCFNLNKKYNAVPKVGDLCKVYTVKGSTVRGVDLNNIPVFYKSDEQLEQEHLEWCANYKSEKQERFDKNKDQMDADYEALPAVFKTRIDRFRDKDPEFRVDSEGYEVFCCKEAVKIAAACYTAEKVTEFYNMKWEDQKLFLPELDDGHSGNTFGGACQMARIYLEGGEL